jgi:plastocyanin
MVTFTWAAGSATHNVTWDTGPTTFAGSGDQSSGNYQTPALSAGNYTYHCTFHVNLYNMRGTIVVK